MKKTFLMLMVVMMTLAVEAQVKPTEIPFHKSLEILLY